MTVTSVVFVTADRAIALPPEIQATLQPGDKYLVWQTDDTILLKKVQKPIAFKGVFWNSDVVSEGFFSKQLVILYAEAILQGRSRRVKTVNFDWIHDGDSRTPLTFSCARTRTDAAGFGTSCLCLLSAFVLSRRSRGTVYAGCRYVCGAQAACGFGETGG